jgi:hypothetical protein
MRLEYFLSLVLLFLGVGCENYSNKVIYEVTVGDSVDIYYSTNSCCKYCVLSPEKQTKTKLVQNKILDYGEKNCEGCNYIAAYTFRAIAKGVDTVMLQNLGATDDCSIIYDSSKIEKYVIVVK